MKKMKALFITCMMFVLVAMSSIYASAATRPTIAKNIDTFSSYGKEAIFTGIKRDVIKIKKNTKETVATVTVEKEGNHRCVYVTPIKPGTTDISFTVKRADKTYTLKTTLRVLDGQVLTSLTVGKTDLSAKGFLSRKRQIIKKPVTGRLNYTLGKQWRLRNVALVTVRTEELIRVVKPGDKVTINGSQMLVFRVRNKKDKETYFLGYRGR